MRTGIEPSLRPLLVMMARRRSVAAALVAGLALIAAGCGTSEEERVEQALLEYTDGDPSYEADGGDVQSTDCRPLGDEMYRGKEVFYCEVTMPKAIASVCVARLDEELWFGTGRADCWEDAFRAYPTDG